MDNLEIKLGYDPAEHTRDELLMYLREHPHIDRVEELDTDGQ